MAALGGHCLPTFLVHGVSGRSNLCRRHMIYAKIYGMFNILDSLIDQTGRRHHPSGYFPGGARQPNDAAAFLAGPLCRCRQSDLPRVLPLEFVHPLDLLASVVVSPQPPLSLLSHAKKSQVTLVAVCSYHGIWGSHSENSATGQQFRTLHANGNAPKHRFEHNWQAIRTEDQAIFHRSILAADLRWWSIGCSKLWAGTRSVQDPRSPRCSLPQLLFGLVHCVKEAVQSSLLSVTRTFASHSSHREARSRRARQ